MHVFYSDAHRAHDPPFEFSRDGVYPYSERPARALKLRTALKADGRFAIVAPKALDPASLSTVHDADYLYFLQHIYAAWHQAGNPPTGVIPSTYAVGPQRRRPDTLLRQAGYYIFDAQTPIVAGTWKAALAAASCALAGADALLRGQSAAYALCRPPGHHAATALCGGYSYLNNAALAAARLGPRVAVLDIDYHHGNGTQEIFYRRDDVLFISLHADPERAYPYFSGFADETGQGPGTGYNVNMPLPPGTDDTTYLRALDDALERITAYAPRHLVVSAGLDIFGGDPLGDFDLSLEAFGHIGQRLAGLGLPTLLVQEGGYEVEAGGQALVNLLAPFC